MPQRNTVEIVITASDQASKVLEKVGASTKTLGKVALAGLAGGAIAATGAVIALGAGIVDMTMKAAEVEGTASTFDKLAESVGGNATEALDKLTEATRGMVADADLMAAGNKFFAMGLANTTEEAAQLAETATQLGMAMGEDATDSMENFALMLANQSIPRLDSFGISSGVVRERINELLAANEDMTRETAFMTAVMEQAGETMNKVGEQGDTAAASMNRIGSQVENAGLAIGQAFLPYLGEMLKPIADLVSTWGPRLIEIFGELATWIGPTLGPLMKKLAGFIEGVLLVVGELIAQLTGLGKGVFDTTDSIREFLFGLGLSKELVEKVDVVLRNLGSAIGELIARFTGLGSDIFDTTDSIRELLLGLGLSKNAVNTIDSVITNFRKTITNLFTLIFDKVSSLISFKDVLIVLGIAIASIVIPAIAGLVIAFVSFLAPILALIAAVALLRKAWETDFLGIRSFIAPLAERVVEFVTMVVENFAMIRKALGFSVQAFLELPEPLQKIVAAMLRVKIFVEKSLLPIFQAVVGFFKTAVPAAINFLNRAFESIGEVYRSSIKPALDELMGALEELWSALIEAWNTIAPIFAEIGAAFAEAFGKGGGEALTLEKIIKTVADGIILAIKAITVIVKVVADIMGWAAKFISKTWEKHGNTVIKVLGFILKGFKTTFETIKKVVETVFKFLAALVNKFFGKSIIPDGIKKGLTTITAAFTKTTDFLKKLWDDFWKFLQSVAAAISKAIDSLVDAFLNGVKNLFALAQAFISGGWEEFWNLLQQLAQQISDRIRAIVDGWLESLKQLWANAQAAIRAAWDSFWEGLKQKVDEIISAILSAVDNFLNNLRDLFSTITDGIRQVWDNFVNGLQIIVDTVLPAIQAVFDTVLNAIKTLVDTIIGTGSGDGIWGQFKTVFEGLQSVVESVIGTSSESGIWGTITSAFNAIKDAIQDVIDKVQDFIDKLKDVLIPDWLGGGGGGGNEPDEPEGPWTPFSIPTIGDPAAFTGGGAVPVIASDRGSPIFNTVINSPLDEEEFYYRVQEATRRGG